MDEHCKGCIRYLKSCSGLSKELCEKHKLRIPRTNADRIRAMTDEELARFLDNHGRLWGADIVSTADDWLDWLKEEGE